MPHTPRLVPMAPTPGAPLPLATSPFWIGSAAGNGLTLPLPSLADRHVALLEREDGWWVTRARGTTTVNGRGIGEGVRLANGDAIEIAPGYRYQFDSGEPAPMTVPTMDAEPRRKRKRPRALGGTKRSWGKPLIVAVMVILLVTALGLAYYALTREDTATSTLSSADAVYFDDLLRQAYDYIERGNALLEIGASQPALQEFAAGVNVLATSRLRDDPYVKPRIQALEASVAAIYREKHVDVPAAYRDIKAPTVSMAKGLQASLSVEQFAAAFGTVQSAFAAQFRDSVVVTGADHAEHLSLYGKGGAKDLRTRTMPAEQIKFIVDRCRAAGIRVKDFSNDAILQQQIQAAIKAGLADRAGTGLHLHIDRFANRRDAYTVQ